MLRGDDGVDRWTEQSLWDAILKNVKIMVSTYQVLLDARKFTGGLESLVASECFYCLLILQTKQC